MRKAMTHAFPGAFQVTYTRPSHAEQRRPEAEQCCWQAFKYMA